MPPAAPSRTDQITSEAGSPTTLAENVAVPPIAREALAGATTTSAAEGDVWYCAEALGALAGEPPPQAVVPPTANATIHAIAIRFCRLCMCPPFR
ncbi:hypothetical protein AMYX_29070 [Anaeromyxobacter diazotrophicus]|uniref:Uncharacterized protein n=1 Tax=Anaeromyxobacter diazotrophicus TaxID=2590199 RepID=A0A7I9VP31_9BACT|nr:hypothetical protein AMYX_29070 [Anaeromyxobacter diazotrophicus]